MLEGLPPNYSSLQSHNVPLATQLIVNTNYLFDLLTEELYHDTLDNVERDFRKYPGTQSFGYSLHEICSKNNFQAVDRNLMYDRVVAQLRTQGFYIEYPFSHDRSEIMVYLQKPLFCGGCSCVVS
jgi:hypothetical protein